MMQTEILREIVAKVGGTEPDKIGPDFSLETPELKGSIKRVALAASIRKQLGVNCPTAHTVTTFSELEQAVFGETAKPVPARPANGVAHAAPPAPAMTTAIAAPGLAVTPKLGAAELRCGVDIEMISDLPEAADYREHEFYKESFSPEEMAYCLLQQNPRMHFAARWCAKEALHKCDPAFRGEKMANVEVVRTEKGDVFLRHHANGTACTLPHAVSLSHTNSMATAFVVQAVNGVAANVEATNSAPVAEIAPPITSNSVSTLNALAWIVAIGTAVLALVRTLR